MSLPCRDESEPESVTGITPDLPEGFTMKVHRGGLQVGSPEGKAEGDKNRLCQVEPEIGFRRR